MARTGWDKCICKECAYRKGSVCCINHAFIDGMSNCPEHYTYELIREISEDISKRIRNLPHGDIFLKEW